MVDYKHEFIKLFSNIAPSHHRYKVWSDFIHMSAFSLYNSVARNDDIESEYHQIKIQYKSEDRQSFAKLLSYVVEGLEDKFQDFLGSCYMDLELGNSNMGQFFTPYPVSLTMAKLTLPDDIKPGRIFRLTEPAAGSGGCVIAVVEALLSKGINPQETLFVSCVELDETVAMMCYIQLSLLGIGAEVVVGNSLSGAFKKTFVTPMFIANDWETKFKVDKTLSFFDRLSFDSDIVSEPKIIDVPPCMIDAENLDYAEMSVPIQRIEEEQLILF